MILALRLRRSTAPRWPLSYFGQAVGPKTVQVLTAWIAPSGAEATLG